MTVSNSMVDSYKAFNKTKTSSGLVVGFWISTVLFALQMSFTAYAQLRLPQVAETFAHLGFPAISVSSSRGPSWRAWPHCSSP